jgi:hypothetical protein
MTAPRRLLARRAATPLFDAATTRAIEQRAAATLPAHALMSRAGLALLRLVRAIAPHARTIWIAAGPGNNGGDGLVLATLLHQAGAAVRVSLVGHSAHRALPADAAWALANARAAGVALDDWRASTCASTRCWASARRARPKARSPPRSPRSTPARRPCSAWTCPPAWPPTPVRRWATPSSAPPTR